MIAAAPALVLAMLAAAPPTLSGVVKAEKAAKLPPAAREALARDSSVRLAGREKHFFSLYDRNAYEGIPSFVSLDVVLHLFHVRLDGLVADAERDVAAPALQAFAQGQTERALALLPKSGPADAAAERLVLFHAIPAALLAPAHPKPPALPDALAARVSAALAALEGKGTLEPGLCQRPLDPGQFKPRGHYDSALRDYFQAWQWYAQCAFDLESPEGLHRSLDLLRLPTAEDQARLATVRSLADLIAGPADDPDLAALATLRDPTWPPLPSALSVAQTTAVAAKVRTLPQPKALAQAGPGEPAHRVFRMLGGSATADSLALQTAALKEQKLPSVLHVLAPLGSADAAALLGVPSVPTAAQEARTLQGRWLEILGLVVQRPAGDQLPFARADTWARHLTVAAAGSWAELRHDTLLYVKQPMVWMEGGHDAELPAVKAAGYVEPRPEIYRALSALLGDVAGRLGKDARSKHWADQLQDLLAFLTEVSELELANKPFPKEADERLRVIGGELEHLTRGFADELPPQALVCDVLDFTSEAGERQVLHAGVGAADELWVIVPRGGKRLLTRGGAFSYYEFGHPERLSDHDFSELLEGPKPPPRPDWSRPVAAAPGPKRKSRD